MDGRVLWSVVMVRWSRRMWWICLTQVVNKSAQKFFPFSNISFSLSIHVRRQETIEQKKNWIYFQFIKSLKSQKPTLSLPVPDHNPFHSKISPIHRCHSRQPTNPNHNFWLNREKIVQTAISSLKKNRVEKNSGKRNRIEELFEKCCHTFLTRKWFMNKCYYLVFPLFSACSILLRKPEARRWPSHRQYPAIWISWEESERERKKKKSARVK